MSQITREFAQLMHDRAKDGIPTSLTVWEMQQLAWAWLRLADATGVSLPPVAQPARSASPDQTESAPPAQLLMVPVGEPYELDDLDRQLLVTVRKAVSYDERGDPAKDVIDEDEMVDAMRLLLQVISPTGACPFCRGGAERWVETVGEITACPDCDGTGEATPPLPAVPKEQQ